MKRPACIATLLLALLPTVLPAADKDSSRVLDGKASEDSRLGKAKTLNDYFPFTPPTSKEAWEARRKELREQVLVANGLWPMPPKTPLHAVIHGKIDRDDYTIEKVFFTSHPGHYVCGNLYRPKGVTGKAPAVLCPHGHWANGRFYDAGNAAARDQIRQGAEKTIEGAHFPLQARCAQLARMGCVVFHYDMIGYADSLQIPHRVGFTDASAELRLQNFMGLQTWNSIRALDFLLGLPEVDAQRIGVTGASGGGTQTFILCAVDDRPTAAFPAVMVSTAMQGGCVCENCSYLRQATGNIELAGLFAPKPLGMSGAKDWTVDIETKGLPELKALYKLYGAEDRAMARCFPEFGHNYNQVSREVMYNWFNKHLRLGLPEPIVEKPFVPVPPKELSVFDAEHRLPSDAVNVQALRRYLTQTSDKQMQSLEPTEAGSLKEYRRVIGTALRVLAGGGLPDKVDVKGSKEEKLGELKLHKSLLGRSGEGDAVPALGVVPPDFDRTVTIWIHPKGKASLFENGKPVPAAQAILAKKSGILAIDCLGTGEQMSAQSRKVDPAFAGFTFGYNRPLLAERVRDVLTAVAFARDALHAKTIRLVGWGEAGPWVLLARGLCGDAVARTAVDANQFHFGQIEKTADEMMLPGAVKYGDLPGFAALCAPLPLLLHNVRSSELDHRVKAAYRAAQQDASLQLTKDTVLPEKLIAWLFR